MEILILFFVWVLVLYIIKINKELYHLRKSISSNKEIYIPSFNEIMKANIWYLQIYRIVKNLLNERRQFNIERRRKIQSERKIAISRLVAFSDESD